MVTAEFLTAALALLALGSLLKRAPVAERKLLLLCAAAILPMSWLMFHGVRLPFDGWLASKLPGSPWLFWIRSAYAPLTEEPAKIWPLLLLPVRRQITAENFGRFAVALGLGFAIGEIFMVGQLAVAHKPEFAHAPWWQFGGFINERLLTCAIHPGMVALTLAGWRRWRSFPLGLMAAMLAHFAANFPIGMAHRGWLGPNVQVQQLILTFWVLFCAAVAVVWLISLLVPGQQFDARYFGDAICPECHQRYTRSVFGLNAGLTLRFERCPYCRHWHWTERADPVR